MYNIWVLVTILRLSIDGPVQSNVFWWYANKSIMLWRDTLIGFPSYYLLLHYIVWERLLKIPRLDLGQMHLFTSHSMVVSLWDVTESLYIEISRSDGPQKGLADVDLTHLKSYWVIHTISIAVLGHSKSLWVIQFVSSHPKSSWVIKTSYVRGPPIQNPIYCDSVVTTTTLWAIHKRRHYIFLTF